MLFYYTEKEIMTEEKKLLLEIKAMMSGFAPRDRIISVKDTSKKISLGESTIRAMDGKDGFPSQVPLSTGRKGFRESEIDLWIMNRDKVA